MLTIVPITLRRANAFVKQHHRHAKPVRGIKFAVGIVDAAGALRGVALAGRPVARALDDGTTLEINRVATDGARNACSALYAACRKAAGAMGYTRVVTYTLVEEPGASVRAAGFRDAGKAGRPSGHWHNRPGRSVEPATNDLVGGKIRWEWP